MSDPELSQRPANLGRVLFVDLATRSRGMEIMTAPVGVEAGKQAILVDGLGKTPERRRRSFLFTEKR